MTRPRDDVEMAAMSLISWEGFAACTCIFGSYPRKVGRTGEESVFPDPFGVPRRILLANLVNQARQFLGNRGAPTLPA